MKRSPDVVIVGGGIAGHAIAWELTRAGQNHVLIAGTERSETERASLSAGAMLGALGEVTVDETGRRAEIELDYRLRAARIYAAFLDEVAETTGIRVEVTRGTVVVGNTEGNLDRENLAAISNAAAAAGEDAQWIDWKQVQGLQPARGLRPLGCLFLPNECGVDCRQLMLSLNKVATMSGSVVARDAVSIQRNGNNWDVVLDDYSTITASKLVVAAGARSARLVGVERWTELGLPKLFFGKGVSVVIHDPNLVVEHVIRTPNRAFACGVHLVPRGAGQAYVGATNFFGRDLEKEAGIEMGELHILLDQAIHQINVNIRRSKVYAMRYGFRPVLTTRKPLAGETIDQGLHIATGTYRNGVLMAPLMARHVVEEIVGGKPAAGNPYSPSLAAESDGGEQSAVVERGLRDLLEILREPGGHLPYGRAEELATLVQNLWTLAFEDSPSLTSFRAAVKQHLKDVPLTESVNRLFYEILGTPLKG